MKKIFTLIILIAVSFLSNAQIITRGTTPSSIAAIVPGYNEVSSYNTQTFSYTPSTPVHPPTPVDEDTTTEVIKELNYADSLAVNITMSLGNTTSTSIGKVWTLRIKIPNALNIGFTFQTFNLSASAEMYVFNEARTVVKGAIKKSYFINTTGISVTPLTGNSVIIYIVERGNFGTLQSVIAIKKLMAGYNQIDDVGDTGGSSFSPEGAFLCFPGSHSVACDPLIQCRQDKLSTARAVAMFFPGDGKQCTGTMINNEANNGKGYFLTAFHCVDLNKNKRLDADEITTLQNASFLFQFWRTECNGTVNNSVVEFTGGAVARAYSATSDVLLLELNNAPGIGDGVNYAGWNRNGAEPNDNLSFIIHHPQGADMRITTTKDVKTFFWNHDFWTAHYSSGTVDYGSSGSALFNENNQIVGQLRSGWSCCSLTDFGDRYGKLSSSWSLAGLQQWLSPSQNLQSTYSLDLYPLTIQGAASINCSSNIQYSVPGNLLGCTYYWTVGPNLQIVSGQGTGTLTVKGTQTSNVSSYIQVQITDSKGRNRTATATKNISLSVNKPFIGGTFTNTFDGSIHPLGFYPAVTNPACTGYIINTNMQITGANSITWTKVSSTGVVNYTQNGNDISFYLFANNQNVLFKLDASNVCGTTTNQFKWLSSDCGGGGCDNFTVSPNPATNSINVIVPDIPPPCDIVTSGDSKRAATQRKITEIKIYDNIGNLKKVQQENKTRQATINLTGFKSGVYIVEISDGSYKEKQQIIIQK